MTTSSILSTISRYPGYFFGLSILPSAADQLVQVLFSKRVPLYITEATSILAAAISYTFLSRQLSSSAFNITAPLFYLSYKVTNYWSAKRKPLITMPYPSQNPPSRSKKTPLLSPGSEKETSVSATIPPLKAPPSQPKDNSPSTAVNPEKETVAASLPLKTTPSQPKDNSSSTAVNPAQDTTTASGTISPLPTSNPNSITSASLAISEASEEVKAEREKKARLEFPANLTKGFQALKRFDKIIAKDPQSPHRVIGVNQIPLPKVKPMEDTHPVKVKNEKFKATIRFCETHIFHLDAERVLALNQVNCSVTETTLFFWFELKIKNNKEMIFPNLIPLALLEPLRPNDKTFCLMIKESDRQFNIVFEGSLLDGLKKFAEKIKKCKELETIPSPAIQPRNENSADSSEPILSPLVLNSISYLHQAKCYLEPFMQKSSSTGAV